MPTRSCVCNVFPSFVPKLKYSGGCSIPIKFEICDLNCLRDGCDRIDCGSLFHSFASRVRDEGFLVVCSSIGGQRHCSRVPECSACVGLSYLGKRVSDVTRYRNVSVYE